RAFHVTGVQTCALPISVHRPETDADWRRARETLRFQEALVLQLALLGQRAERRAVTGPPRIPGALSQGFDASLPWPLTDDQKAVGDRKSGVEGKTVGSGGRRSS